MIQGYKLGEAEYRGERFKDFDQDLKGNNDLLSLTQPDIIQAIHKAYFDAGADIAETNTFNSTTISQADYAMEHLVDELNFESARLARAAADAAEAETPGRVCYVAGVLGPTNRTASISPDVNDPGFRNVTFDELRETYKAATIALVKGGSDLILIETVFDTLNAKAAAFAVDEAFAELGFELPIMISGTITDKSGRTLSGQTPEAFWYSMTSSYLSKFLRISKLRASTFCCAFSSALLIHAQEDDPGLARFQKLAAELKIWLLIGSLAIRVSENQAANRQFLLSPKGGIVSTYDKVHMFDVDLANGESYRESKNFAAGSEAKIVDLPWLKLGHSICYDLRFAYQYRLLAQNGAGLLVVPAAFTKRTGLAHWHILLRARAIETGCFVMVTPEDVSDLAVGGPTLDVPDTLSEPVSVENETVDGVDPAALGTSGRTLEDTLVPPADASSLVTANLESVPGGRRFGAIFGQSRIVLRASQNAWLRVEDREGQVLIQENLRENDRYFAPDEMGLILSVRDAGAFDVYVDEQMIGKLGRQGQVLPSVSLDPDMIGLLGANRRDQ